jgi:hypothetical protein
MKAKGYDVPEKLHSQDMRKAINDQKPGERGEKETKVVDLSKERIIIYDRGSFTYLAQFMARFYGKTDYFIPSDGLYLHSHQTDIGKGLKGVNWLESFDAALPNTPEEKEHTTIFFPYVYDGDRAERLKKDGYNVCSSFAAEKMELRKDFFYNEVKKAGLPTKIIYEAHGLDDLEKFLASYRPKVCVLKNCGEERGDWETFVDDLPAQTDALIDHCRAELGRDGAARMIVLCEEIIDGLELGIDGFMLNGEIARWMSFGYELKDDFYICKMIEEIPDILKPSMDALKSAYAKLGCATPYSNEARVTPKGEVYRIDETLRGGCPPTPVFCEMLGEEYARAVYELARGRLPQIKKPVAKYGVMTILKSIHCIKNKLYVKMPKNFEQWVKLHNASMHNGNYFVHPVPLDDDCDTFGSVIGIGDTLEEANEEMEEALEEVKAYKMDYVHGAFECASEKIKEGEKFGVKF